LYPERHVAPNSWAQTQVVSLLSARLNHSIRRSNDSSEAAAQAVAFSACLAHYENCEEEVRFNEEDEESFMDSACGSEVWLDEKYTFERKSTIEG